MKSFKVTPKSSLRSRRCTITIKNNGYITHSKKLPKSLAGRNNEKLQPRKSGHKAGSSIPPPYACSHSCMGATGAEAPAPPAAWQRGSGPSDPAEVVGKVFMMRLM